MYISCSTGRGRGRRSSVQFCRAAGVLMPAVLGEKAKQTGEWRVSHGHPVSRHLCSQQIQTHYKWGSGGSPPPPAPRRPLHTSGGGGVSREEAEFPNCLCPNFPRQEKQHHQGNCSLVTLSAFSLFSGSCHYPCAGSRIRGQPRAPSDLWLAPRMTLGTCGWGRKGGSP